MTRRRGLPIQPTSRRENWPIRFARKRSKWRNPPQIGRPPNKPPMRPTPPSAMRQWETRPAPSNISPPRRPLFPKRPSPASPPATQTAPRKVRHKPPHKQDRSPNNSEPSPTRQRKPTNRSTPPPAPAITRSNPLLSSNNWRIKWNKRRNPPKPFRNRRRAPHPIFRSCRPNRPIPPKSRRRSTRRRSIHPVRKHITGIFPAKTIVRCSLLRAAVDDRAIKGGWVHNAIKSTERKYARGAQPIRARRSRQFRRLRCTGCSGGTERPVAGRIGKPRRRSPSCRATFASQPATHRRRWKQTLPSCPFKQCLHRNSFRCDPAPPYRSSHARQRRHIARWSFDRERLRSDIHRKRRRLRHSTFQSTEWRPCLTASQSGRRDRRIALRLGASPTQYPGAVVEFRAAVRSACLSRHDQKLLFAHCAS